MNHSRLSLNESTHEQIHRHLERCDASFVPQLSGRVNLSEYARKIHDSANRFEAWKEGELAGLLAAYFNESTVFITNISVLPSMRGSGISGTLLERCRDKAIESNHRCLELEVDSRNIIAVGIYKKYGFEVIRIAGCTMVMRLAIGC